MGSHYPGFLVGNRVISSLRAFKRSRILDFFSKCFHILPASDRSKAKSVSSCRSAKVCAQLCRYSSYRYQSILSTISFMFGGLMSYGVGKQHLGVVTLPPNYSWAISLRDLSNLTCSAGVSAFSPCS